MSFCLFTEGDFVYSPTFLQGVVRSVDMKSGKVTVDMGGTEIVYPLDGRNILNKSPYPDLYVSPEAKAKYTECEWLGLRHGGRSTKEAPAEDAKGVGSFKEGEAVFHIAYGWGIVYDAKEIELAGYKPCVHVQFYQYMEGSGNLVENCLIRFMPERLSDLHRVGDTLTIPNPRGLAELWKKKMCP